MKILIAGDYYPGIIQDKDKINNALLEISPLCATSDYSIVNFESPLTSEWDQPIPKCGPCLMSNVITAVALKEAGFNCVTLANNHVLDQGEKSLINTITEFNNIGLDVVGAGKDLADAKKILYKKIGNETLAIINCCEKEFSIATENSPGTNPLNPIQQYYSIKEAKENADFVLMIIHGGHEHYQLPSPRMMELYRYFADCGADAIINHHQHCYSGFEIHNGKPIIYGTGNFLFDGGNRHFGKWNEGYLVKLDTKGRDSMVELIPYDQCKDDFIIKLKRDKFEFISEIQKLNDIISNKALLLQSFEKWVSKSSGMYRNACIPYRNGYLIKASTMGLLPNLLSRDHVLQLLNYVECEAHRDMFISYLQNQIS